MPKKIYLTGIEKKPGKSFISLGVLSVLKTQYPSLQCFKLFSESNDLQSELLRSLSDSAVKPVMEISEGIAMLRDHPETLFAKVLEATRSLSLQDVAYFEGSDFESDMGASGVFEYEFNVSLAYQLNCDLILVVSAKDRSLAQIGSLINSAVEISKKNHARVTAVILNCVLPNQEQETRTFFKKKRAMPDIIIVPEFDYLAHPSVNDVAQKLQAKIICGANALDRMVNQLTVAAKTVGNFLESRLDRKDMLIITPCDRVDILLGSLLADQSANYPKIAGIVLTGGDMPGEAILNIIKGLEHPFPVLLTSTSTYETATILYSAKYRLSIADWKKVGASIQAMLPYLSSPLSKLLAQEETITPVSP
ncbi:MAG: AAA family ATPase, partial [Mycobacteriaceae bacterium]|nr:AAA family ATPase [Mycobacteriaceae bacterium]